MANGSRGRPFRGQQDRLFCMPQTAEEIHLTSRSPSIPCFFGEASRTKIDYRKKGHPYPNLSTGGPRFCFSPGRRHAWPCAARQSSPPAVRRPAQSAVRRVRAGGEKRGRQCEQGRWADRLDIFADRVLKAGKIWFQVVSLDLSFNTSSNRSDSYFEKPP